MIVAERIRERLNAAELTQSELARRVGITQGTIAKLANGSAYGSSHLHKIARELQTTPAYLSGEVDDPDEGAPPPPDLTHDESEMLDAWRQLTAQDQDALHRIMQSMIAPRTLHSPSLSFHSGARP